MTGVVAEPEPGVRQRTPVDGVRVVGSLSPSRAGDFRTCPLMFRLRTIDRLPERPSPDAVRGTVVHRVLEDLFDLPSCERTPERADAMVAEAWAHVLEREPAAGEAFADAEALTAWLETCRTSLHAYFELEDPRRLEPAEREVHVEAVLDSRLLLRGIVDRIDVAADGSVRLVDYKTGYASAPGFEGKALFQLRFYALVLWRTRGVVPRRLELLYFASGVRISYDPDEDDLRATERIVDALWEAISAARRNAEWRPHRSWACGRCSFKTLCPEWGGTPPPLPHRQLEAAGAQASSARRTTPSTSSST